MREIMKNISNLFNVATDYFSKKSRKAEADWQKAQDEKRIEAAVKFQTFLCNDLMAFLANFPLPPDCNVDLGIFPNCWYLGENKGLNYYRVRFYLKDAHDIQGLTLKRNVPNVFEYNLRIAKSQLSNMYGSQYGTIYYPALYKMQEKMEAEQFDPTTVDFIIVMRP